MFSVEKLSSLGDEVVFRDFSTAERLQRLAGDQRSAITGIVTGRPS